MSDGIDMPDRAESAEESVFQIVLVEWLGCIEGEDDVPERVTRQTVGWILNGDEHDLGDDVLLLVSDIDSAGHCRRFKAIPVSQITGIFRCLALPILEPAASDPPSAKR